MQIGDYPLYTQTRERMFVFLEQLKEIWGQQAQWIAIVRPCTGNRGILYSEWWDSQPPLTKKKIKEKQGSIRLKGVRIWVASDFST